MTLDQYLRIKGNTAVKLGAAIGVSHASVLRYASGDQTISGERAMQIEQATNGAVSRSDLRPDLWPASEAAA